MRREQKVDVTIYTLRNGVVRVEDVEDSLYAAIDLVCDKVMHRVMLCKMHRMPHAPNLHEFGARLLC